MTRSCPDRWLRLRLASLHNCRPRRALGLTKEVRHYETVEAAFEKPCPAYRDRSYPADMDMLRHPTMHVMGIRSGLDSSGDSRRDRVHHRCPAGWDYLVRDCVSRQPFRCPDAGRPHCRRAS